MRDWVGLETVEFVEGAVDGGVGDEMVEVVGLRGLALGFVDEGRGAGERVVDCAD